MGRLVVATEGFAPPSHGPSRAPPGVRATPGRVPASRSRAQSSGVFAFAAERRPGSAAVRSAFVEQLLLRQLPHGAGAGDVPQTEQAAVEQHTECGGEPGPVGGEQRLGTAADHRHDCVVAVTQRLAHGTNEGGREQWRVDAAGERELGLARRARRGPRADPRAARRRRPGRRRRSRRAAAAPAPGRERRRPAHRRRRLAHDRDRVRDGRRAVPVEQRLGPSHPTRSAAREDDRPCSHLSRSRAPARAGSRSAP